MTTTTEIHNRERLGWIFLLTGFAVFLAIAVTVPLSINAYLHNSTKPLDSEVQANQGTVRIEDSSGPMRATLLGEPAQSIEAGSEILTDATATALISVRPPASDQLLARIQMYGNTNLRLDRMDTPRFELSDGRQVIELSLQSGRLRLTVPEPGDRPFSIHITAPHGDIDITEPGQYSFEVTNNMTQAAVRSGVADVYSANSRITLAPDQRAIIPNGGEAQGPMSNERNLVVNGGFSDLFDQWTMFTWNVELADQPKGSTAILPVGGEPTLRITRQGEGHADIRMRQTINQDVTDYESLQLLITYRIVSQSLAVCGFAGSECPLFLRVNYLDSRGIAHTWQHGFYGNGTIPPGGAPDACVSCDVVQGTHQRVQFGQVNVYEVDFRADLARQGYLPPSVIESVSLVSSGHSFEVDVMDVALMARE